MAITASKEMVTGNIVRDTGEGACMELSGLKLHFN